MTIWVVTAKKDSWRGDNKTKQLLTGNKFISEQKDQGQFMLIFIFWK